MEIKKILEQGLSQDENLDVLSYITFSIIMGASMQYLIDENMREHFQKDKEMNVFEPFNIEIVRKRFLRIKRALMLPTDFSVTLKTFRKTFATRMAERGLTIQEVAYLLGHDSVQTTERFYTDVIADSVRKRINNLK